MTTPPPPLGLFGLPDIGKVIDSVTNLLPPQVADAIKNVTEKILDPSDPSVNIGDSQPEGEKPIPVDAGTPELGAAVKAIDAVVGALNLIEKFNFIVPDKYEDLLSKLKGALLTIRSWLD